MRLRAVTVGLLALAAVGATGRLVARATQDRFDHWQHRALFPSCTGCHAGATDPGRPLYPAAADCAECHDGAIEQRVAWSPPAGPHPGNLRFTHVGHAADSTLACASCHTARGEQRMRVRRAVVENCLDCHGVRTAHLDAPDGACATCHLPLARAAGLTRADVAEFDAPDSHRRPDFSREHGRLAKAGKNAVAASCATCHARDFCLECHVNGPEEATIQALAPDSRALALTAELKAPGSHSTPTWLSRHGGAVGRSGQACATCHTQESCLACHAGTPAVAAKLASAGPGRAPGARTTRIRPASHGADFSELHAQPASARPQSCAGCHARSECLSCHRPDPAAATPGYHPAGFLTTHPSAAYSRESSCADCHNQAQFCTTCHVSAGLVSSGRLRGTGYHDAKQQFLLNHGQAARQSLESCASCHSDRDCLTCHSAQGGRRFNPHGPGFDPATLRRKAPSMCTACHGAAIPE